MDQPFTLLLALSIGFTHAFEADHLVAVSNIVTRRNNVWLALKDGIYWGVGHTSTILLVGSIFLLGKFALHKEDFQYLEAGVGVMLFGLGSYRLYRLTVSNEQSVWNHQHHDHSHAADSHAHKLAYGVGLVHGLAGSGALVLSVLTQIKGAGAGLLYLGLFGSGSIGGMMVAAGVFSIPFSGGWQTNPSVRKALVLMSSICCIGLGLRVFWENVN